MGQGVRLQRPVSLGCLLAVDGALGARVLLPPEDCDQGKWRSQSGRWYLNGDPSHP